MTHLAIRQMRTPIRKKSKPQGLILLIALGMLAMFSLLAVTYMVFASSSLVASQSMVTKARNSNVTIEGTSQLVANALIRGTNDPTSALYKHGLVEDIYGPNPLRSRFGNTQLGAIAFRPDWCRLLSPTTPLISGTGPNLVKVSLLNSLDVVNGPLSPFENEYNSRILTVLEGPLAGQSFRIVKYVGYVRSPSATTADPNVPNVAPWSTQSYTDPLGNNIEYSVLIDLSDVKGAALVGQRINGVGKAETITLSLVDWVKDFGVASLFFLNNATPSGYSFMINDTAFNSAGIGMNDLETSTSPPPLALGFGTLDSREFMKLPTSRPWKIPPALLPNYDYLSKTEYMSVPVDGIGIAKRKDLSKLLNGSSNEGFDVPDWHDFWLAHGSYYNGMLSVIPSFHRPEMVNYISGLYGAPSSMSLNDVREMIQLIDASTARIMRYSFQTGPGTFVRANPGFRSNVDTNNPLLDVASGGTFTWSSPPTGSEITALQTYVANQITGPWDVDNDKDGANDSVLINPGLPIVYAPDGRMLRPVASVFVEDLDSRININTAGDRSQGLPGYNNLNLNLTVNRAKAAGASVPQGAGVGPAEISLSSLLPAPALGSPTVTGMFSIFDDRYGAGRYVRRPINLGDVALDRVPGRRRLSALFPENDNFSQFFEREIHDPSIVMTPSGRRGSVAAEMDRNGDLAFINQRSQDADVYAFAASNLVSEIDDDPYEANALEKSTADDPFGLTDLAAILLRFEGDSSALPRRLKAWIEQTPGYFDRIAINRLITTRSAELRYPNLVAAMKTTNPTIPGASVIDFQASSLQRWVQMLHAQRYRPSTSSPQLTQRAIEELFTTDFAKGLRMDLNRPFGNGFDDDGDGQIDDPEELITTIQQERFSSQSGTNVPATGDYHREIQTTMSGSGSGSRLAFGSRQIFARNLYCLAQLIVPRDFSFASMGTGPVLWNRANIEIRAAALAQWAINVVDFRDSDFGMTRFEYDILPFGTEAIAGLPAREAYWAPNHLDQAINKDFVGVVWGMEMPELLITETLGLHDKRVRDTDLESPTTGTPSLYDPNDTNKDQNYDQYRFPLASLFIELYNPRTTGGVGVPTPQEISLPGVGLHPSEGLYMNDAGRAKLDLERMAPANGSRWGRQPVWRLAISESDATNRAKVKGMVDTPSTLATITHQSSSVVGGANWPATTGDPDDVSGSGLRYDLSNATATPTEFDRFVWFSRIAPLATQEIPDLKRPNGIDIPVAEQRRTVYYNRSSTNAAPAYLPGGAYVVVGPRLETEIGSSSNSRTSPYDSWGNTLERASLGPKPRPAYSPSFQRISLAGQTATTHLINDIVANDPWRGMSKVPLGIACAAEPPNDPLWASAFPQGIGINASLPNPIATGTGGSPLWAVSNAPDRRVNSSDPGFAALPPDSWVDTAGSITGALKNNPFDDKATAGSRLNSEIQKFAPNDDSPLGTYETVRAVYLQRLADPDFAYDPESNPYITVDWMAIDVTIFNGEAPFDARVNKNNPDDPKSTIRNKFQTRYKDGKYMLGGAGSGFSYQSPSTSPLEPTQPQDDPASVPADARFKSYFKHQLGYRAKLPNWTTANLGNSGTTLGFVNSGFTAKGGPLLTAAQMADMTGANAASLDGFGPPTSLNDASQPVAAPYIGAPRNITNLAWLNRPFSSPNELMLVPFTGPGQFGYFHSAFTSTGRKPFEYLPSFFACNPLNTEEGVAGRSFWMNPSLNVSGPPPAGPSIEGDMQLLFELVETQPPFADASRVVQPNAIANMIAAATGSNDAVALRFLDSSIPPGYYGTGTPDTVRGPGLAPPFNTFPSFVAAGKININTITEDDAGNVAALKAIEENFLPVSLRGLPNNPLQAAFMNSRRGFALPTVPAGVSSFFTGSVNPAPQMDARYPTQFAGAFRPASSANLAPYVEDAEARQKMRGKQNVETTLARSLAPTTSAIYTNPITKVAADNYNREAPMFSSTTEAYAFAQYQRNMRLPNLVTNQSNVFAVWVTVSLYEYDPILGFGNEYTDDRGEPKRERTFYIIDRSIPVGFKPGENLNTDRTILYQRKLD